MLRDAAKHPTAPGTTEKDLVPNVSSAEAETPWAAAVAAGASAAPPPLRGACDRLQWSLDSMQVSIFHR